MAPVNLGFAVGSGHIEEGFLKLLKFLEDFLVSVEVGVLSGACHGREAVGGGGLLPGDTTFAPAAADAQAMTQLDTLAEAVTRAAPGMARRCFPALRSCR